MSHSPKVFATLADGRRALVRNDVLDLDRRVKYGDPAAGWRGDTEMYVVVNKATDEVEVWGLDIEFTPYRAASMKPAAANWREELIAKLVRGDWQKATLFTDIDRANKARADAVAKEHDDQNLELAEKLAWAIQRDADGTNMYGTFFPAPKETAA